MYKIISALNREGYDRCEHGRRALRLGQLELVLLCTISLVLL